MIAARNSLGGYGATACCMAVLVAGMWNVVLAQPSAPAGARPKEVTEEQLRRWLRQYPEADADRDGVLTWPEADAYRRKLAERRAGQDLGEVVTEFAYATMSDGVKIALAVAYPRGFDPEETSRKWPTIFRMSGYPSAAGPASPGAYGHKYVTVRASVRGSGASEGAIRVISRRTGMDGYEIIEDWIVKQPWSDGKVAIEGHSWSGLTGFSIAATNPPHLAAVAVSGLFDDAYRGIACMGGVRNSGFPVSWMTSLYRPTGVFGSGQAVTGLRGIGDEEYARLLSARRADDLGNHLLWITLTQPEDSAEWQERSPGAFAQDVRAPIYVMHAYQDQQTGPSGVWLWHKVPDDVPKRLVLTNGDHGMTGRFPGDRQEWFDAWLLGDGKRTAADVADRRRRVRVHFETKRTPSSRAGLNEPLVSSDFPLPETVWRRYYCRKGGQLLLTPPPAGERGRGAPGDTYRVAVGPEDERIDRAAYTLEFDEPTAICGPIVVSLWARSSTLDTDFFVLVSDVDDQGNVEHLQRGMLRASHRGLDEERSVWVTRDGENLLIRPHHPHRDPKPLTPGEPYRFHVEVFPMGHVFREGHKLALSIGQPPLEDPVVHTSAGEASYLYQSAQPPGTVTLLRDREHPSSILLPVLPELPPIRAESPQRGSQAGIRSVAPDQ